MSDTVTLTRDEAAAVTWAIVAKVAAKEQRRDLLETGVTYKGHLHVVANLDGATFEKVIDAQLSVGHESSRATSIAADRTALIALVLSKLNTATRENLVRDLPELFAGAGNQLPEVDPTMLALAESLLKRLRGKGTQTVKGTVGCRYELADV